MNYYQNNTEKVGDLEAIIENVSMRWVAGKDCGNKNILKKKSSATVNKSPIKVLNCMPKKHIQLETPK